MVGIGAMVLNVILSLIFILVFEALGWMPLGGLALSNSLATTIEMAVLLGIATRGGGRVASLAGSLAHC